jgi:hypothetical protein
MAPPSRRLVVLAAAALAAACAATPEPPIPTGIAVTPLEEGRLSGGRAVYAVDAPLSAARDVILDFPSQADFRPTVVKAESLEAGETGGTVRFTFQGLLGVQPEATCDYAVEETDDGVRISFVMTDPSFTLSALRGSFELTSVAGGAKTLVDQRTVVSALMMNRRRFLEELREDAAAIRAEIERRYAGGR